MSCLGEHPSPSPKSQELLQDFSQKHLLQQNPPKHGVFFSNSHASAATLAFSKPSTFSWSFSIASAARTARLVPSSSENLGFVSLLRFDFFVFTWESFYLGELELGIFRHTAMFQFNIRATSNTILKAFLSQPAPFSRLLPETSMRNAGAFSAFFCAAKASSFSWAWDQTHGASGRGSGSTENEEQQEE